MVAKKVAKSGGAEPKPRRVGRRPGPPKVRTHVSLDARVNEAIEKSAELAGEGFSEHINTLCMRALGIQPSPQAA